jgi:carbon monoxide dehydrogenase subunit G
MKAQISKNFHVDESVDKVWEYLSNPEKIASCVPGATLTEVIDEKNFKGEVVMKFGPVKAKYNGDISIEEMDHDAKKMTMKGVGKDSKGKGSAEMLMNGAVLEAEEGGSNIDFNMDISVNGMLAQFGSRLITDVSDQITEQFVGNFKAKLAGEEIGDNSIKAGSLAGSVLKSKIGGLFGGSKNA